MGFIALRCPSCGAEIELDDSRDFAFCSYCGTKMVREKQTVEHNVNIRINHDTGWAVDKLTEDPTIPSVTPKKNKLVGFRSNTLWKKVLAVMFYIGVAITFFAYFSSGEYDHTTFDVFVTKISAVLIALVFLFPYFWASDVFNWKTKYKKATNGKIWRFINIPCVVVIALLLCIGTLESNKSEEYQAALEANREQTTVADVESTTEKKKKETTTEKQTSTTTKTTTTTKPTTTVKQKEKVDSTKQITLMMMNEDIAKDLANYPATVEFKSLYWTFEKEGNTYTTGSTFECLNAFGVLEEHILIVVSEEYNNGNSVKAKKVYLDGVEISSKSNKKQ